MTGALHVHTVVDPALGEQLETGAGRGLGRGLLLHRGPASVLTLPHVYCGSAGALPLFAGRWRAGADASGFAARPRSADKDRCPSVFGGEGRGHGACDPRADALQIEQTMAAGQGIVDWQQNNEEVLRVMRREIKRNLRRPPGLSEVRLADLALSMVEIARRRLAG